MLSYVTNEMQSKNKEFFGALLQNNSKWKCSYKITRTRPCQTEPALPACIQFVSDAWQAISDRVLAYS